MKSLKLETKEERVEGQKTSMWSWKINPNDLKNQVDNYNNLKITESYRGISFLIIVGILALSLLIAFWGVYEDTTSILYSLIIYVPILIFLYRGHRWAIISMMILWTLEKGIMLYDGGGIMQIIWWLIVMPYFWKALMVENEKRKINTTTNDDSQASASFCNKCGNAVGTGVKFCIKCGNKII